MEVQVRVECLGVEVIDRGGVLLRDVAVAHGLTNHCPVLAFRQGMIKKNGRVIGVHSLSDETPTLFAKLFLFKPGEKYSDWKFLAE